MRQPVGYESRLDLRHAHTINLLVVHCTELPDLSTARDYAERILYQASQTGACGHYYLDRDGSGVEYVAAARIAHHCVGYNPRSLGVELVNRGRWPDWLHARHQLPTEAYPPAQIEALIALARTLRAQLPGVRWIAGHAELDPRTQAAADDPRVQVQRRIDPGPLFPWATVLRALPGWTRL